MLLSVAGACDVELGVLAELGEEFMDAGDDGLVCRVPKVRHMFW
jgi:hypothetical protein